MDATTLRAYGPLAAVGALGLLLAVGLWSAWPAVAAWALETQAAAQSALARAVAAVRAGDLGAIWGLIGACFVYGVAHAVGPGHGKMLIGGAAAASRRTAWRMAAIGFSASLAQGATAVALVGVGVGAFAFSHGWATEAAERTLAPLSYAAIALIGVWIAWRGARGLLALRAAAAGRAGPPGPEAHGHPHAHGDHGHVCHAGCRHGPTAAETERAESWRDVAALIAGIGVRPCSGALIVLVIAWSFGIFWVGVLGAMAMAVGTGLVVAGVGLAAASARDGARLRQDDRSSRLAFSGVQLGAGALVAAGAFALMTQTLDAPPPPPPGGVFAPR